MQMSLEQLVLLRKLFQKGNSKAFKRFIKDIVNPLLEDFDLKGDGDSLEARIALFFGLSYRDILLYRSNSKFYMPGSLRNHMKVKVRSLKKLRKVAPGDIVIIRYDNRDPTTVEAQILTNFFFDKDDTKVFKMSVEDYYDIKENFKGERLL